MKTTLVSLAAISALSYSWPALADLSTGLTALKRQDYKTAFKEIEPDAKIGNPKAQMGLGYFFDQGYGTAKSYTQAVAWYRKAAAQGNGEAMEQIGNHYAYGLGVKQDMPTAVEWMRKAMDAGTYAYPQLVAGVSDEPATKKRFDDSVAATIEMFRRKAEQGDTTAQANLGYMYLINLCTTPQNTTGNQAQAAGWIRNAAEKGNAAAQGLLGFMYAKELMGERDQVEAVKWYQLAANQGNANAQYNLAVIYDGVDGWKYPTAKSVPKNLDKAKEWAAKAARQGVTRAQTLLGALLLKGGTTEKDHIEALSWLRNGAQQADPEAQVLIGDIYASGTGVAKDYPQAIAWYRKAVDSSSSKIAYGRLGGMYEKGLGVPQDKTQALQLYEKAADSMFDAPLHIKLARMYEEGIGTAKDGSKAVQHYGSAALTGDVESMTKLRDVFEKGLLGQKADPEKTKFWKERISKDSGAK